MIGLIRVSSPFPEKMPPVPRPGHFRAATFDYWETLIEERERGNASLEANTRLFYNLTRDELSLPEEARFWPFFEQLLEETRSRMTGELWEVPLDRFFTELFTRLGLPSADCEKAARHALAFITERVHEISVVLEGAAGFLALLKGKGIRLGLVSNTQIPPRERTESLRRLGLLDFFDAVVLSSEVMHRKPKVEIFREALRRLEVLPEDCLHFGDSPAADIAGARQAGIVPILVLASRYATATESPVVIRDWKSATDLFARLI